MGYEGGKLTSLFAWLPAREAAVQIAEDAGDHMKRKASEYTPMGETGIAKRSWRVSDPKRTRVGDDVAVETEVSSGNRVVHWLNDGTKPHEITPDKAEALQLPEGVRESVHVSGIEPHKMIERAAADTEVALPEIAAPALEEWARKTEAEAKKHRGVS